MKKLLIIILLSLCCALSSTAQKLTDTDITFAADPMDLTARTYERLDRNGVKCALLKVQVLAADVRFQGNVMGDVRREPGEYWVYMTNGTKQVKILSDSFLPYMYYFPEPLQGGVTYVLTLQAPQASDAHQKIKENFLVLKVQPANAYVFVDGAPKAVEDGVVSVPLAGGIHTYRVEAPGYASQEASVTMAGKREARTVTLVSVKPTLTVTAATPGTEIFVNLSRKGVDKWSGELLPGEYVVEGRLAAHRTHSEKIALTDGHNITVAIPVLEPITGSLSVNYKPVDAAITVDGRPAGVTPNVIADLLVGTHRIEISAPGYTPVILTATVADSQTSTLSGSLTPAATAPVATTKDDAAAKDYRHFRDSATGKVGFKHNGAIVIPPKYDGTGDFSEGLAMVLIDGKRGFIDKNGKMIIPPQYDGAGNFSEGLAWVKIKGKYGFIDKSGNMVIPAKYDDAEGFSEGVAGVKTKGKWGFIDKSGNLVIPAQYTYVLSFSEGLAMVGTNGKCGFIDKSGNLVIPAKYDSVSSFDKGKAYVKLNGQGFYIDRNGNEVE